MSDIQEKTPFISWTALGVGTHFLGIDAQTGEEYVGEVVEVVRDFFWDKVVLFKMLSSNVRQVENTCDMFVWRCPVAYVSKIIKPTKKAAVLGRYNDLCGDRLGSYYVDMPKHKNEYVFASWSSLVGHMVCKFDIKGHVNAAELLQEAVRNGIIKTVRYPTPYGHYYAHFANKKKANKFFKRRAQAHLVKHKESYGQRM